MSGRRRAVSVIVHPDGALRSRTYRIPLWVLRGGLVLAVGVAVALILGVTFYTPVLRQAARVPGLEHQVHRLRSDNARIRDLALALDSVEANYARLRRMVGADIVPDPVARKAALPVAPAILVRPGELRTSYEVGLSLPRHWPLEERGYVTRGQVGADSTDEKHVGIDIAVPAGTLVRAAGGGTVLQAGEDPAYGLFVLIQHPQGYQTRYGHLSRVIASPGAEIMAGEVVGRSGNTGRSTAPHLHFEIRRHGVSVDPLTMVKEER